MNNLHGTSLREFGPATDYVVYEIITDPPGQFKQYKINTDWKEYQELGDDKNGYTEKSIYGESLGELVKNGQEFEDTDLDLPVGNKKSLKYIIVKEQNSFYPFLSDLYSNEDNYPYMIKIFDSQELGYKKLKVKVFEIDYEKFSNIDK